MNISQTGDSVFTKQLNKHEADALASVKRYLEYDRGNKAIDSIDEIVLECLRRIKEEVLSGALVLSVTTINGKTGKVELTPEDIKAEPKITKNTAFNKNFGNEKDTVCQGNDKRLFDKREPLDHKHKEYYSNNNIGEAIEDFLKSKGIEFSDDGNCITFMRDIILKNSELKEV